MYIDKLHDIFHLLFLFLQFFHLQHININYSNLFQSFPNMLAMLIMVLLKSEQNQVHVFQYICLKSFQIQQPIIMYHFESTSHKNHLNFLVQSLFKASVCKLSLCKPNSVFVISICNTFQVWVTVKLFFVGSFVSINLYQSSMNS